MWTTGVHPDLILKINTVLTAMAVLGYPMRVTDGLRTDDRQRELYKQGRSTPGPIVTKADGVIHRSNHQTRLDGPYMGFGAAVDSCFQGNDPYLEREPRAATLWRAYGALVEAVGLKWGGGAAFLKAGLNDRPHAELI